MYFPFTFDFRFLTHPGLLRSPAPLYTIERGTAPQLQSTLRNGLLLTNEGSCGLLVLSLQC